MSRRLYPLMGLGEVYITIGENEVKFRIGTSRIYKVTFLVVGFCIAFAIIGFIDSGDYQTTAILFASLALLYALLRLGGMLASKFLKKRVQMVFDIKG